MPTTRVVLCDPGEFCEVNPSARVYLLINLFFSRGEGVTSCRYGKVQLFFEGHVKSDEVRCNCLLTCSVAVRVRHSCLLSMWNIEVRSG